jgi:hypothetical protein
VRPRASRFHLHVEELVLDGFPAGARYGIGDALATELTRLLTERGVPPAFRVAASIDRAAATVHLPPAARPEAVGASVGRAVYGGLRR